MTDKLHGNSRTYDPEIEKEIIISLRRCPLTMGKNFDQPFDCVLKELINKFPILIISYFNRNDRLGNYLQKQYGVEIFDDLIRLNISDIDIKNLIERGTLFNREESIGKLITCNRSLDLIKFLHDKRYRIKSYSFIDAVKNKNLELIDYMIESGCVVDDLTYLQISNIDWILTKHIIEKTIQPSTLETCLSLAQINNDKELLKFIKNKQKEFDN